MSTRVRFAPSPTGDPHVGNIRTAIFNWLFVRKKNGSFILRIEDTDRERYSKKALQNIKESLLWLGLDWDEGPEAGGDYGPYFQSDRLDIYHEYIEKMIDRGWAYYCTCSEERLENLREEQEAKDLPPQYDRKCRDKNIQGAPTDTDKVIRFKTPLTGAVTFKDYLRGEVEFKNNTLDDFVLIKSDGWPTYHFANIVDDHLMDITHVMRAEEWIPSTGKHVLMYEALDFEPPKFVHLPMILGKDKSKLSKRHGAVSVLEYREKGYLSEALFNFLALLGWSPKNNREIMDREEMIQEFSLDSLNKSAGVFDIEKLKWMNGEYITKANAEKLANKALPFLKEENLIEDDSFVPFGEEYVYKVFDVLKSRMKTLRDITEIGSYFFTEIESYEKAGIKNHLKEENVKEDLRIIRDKLNELSEFSTDKLEEVIRSTAKERGKKAAKLIHPIRLATSGMTVGPGLFTLLQTLGQERVVKRLTKLLDNYSEIVDKV